MNFAEQDQQLNPWWHGLLARALDRLEACPTIFLVNGRITDFACQISLADGFCHKL
jgi:hypothetical protein